MNALPLEPLLKGLRRGLAQALLVATTVAAGTSHAAPAKVESFDTKTWASLRAQAGEPLLVVFTTTWCAVCPETFDTLAKAIGRGTVKARLVGVVMDRAPGEDDSALLANTHYRHAARLFAFDGQEAALRHSVDPRWRAVTPYVVYLAPGQAPRSKLGTPSDKELADWSRR